MCQEAMLFEEALAIANGAGMTLDEDAAVASGDDTGCGERPRAYGEDSGGSNVVGKTSEDRAHFFKG
jgi:hypothetical protein